VTQSKAVPLRHESAKGESSYSSYSFLTSALDGVSGQRHAPAAMEICVCDVKESSRLVSLDTHTMKPVKFNAFSF
jgi:hypothetical protein